MSLAALIRRVVFVVWLGLVVSALVPGEVQAVGEPLVVLAPERQEVAPGEVVTQVFNISNHTSDELTVVLSASSPLPVLSTLGTRQVPPGDSLVPVTQMVPLRTQAGPVPLVLQVELYGIHFTAQAEVVVRRAAGLRVQAPPRVTGTGGVATVLVEVENTGNATDTFALTGETLAGSRLMLWPAELTLPPQGRGEARLLVMLASASEAVTVTAASYFDPAVRQEVVTEVRTAGREPAEQFVLHGSVTATLIEDVTLGIKLAGPLSNYIDLSADLRLSSDAVPALTGTVTLTSDDLAVVLGQVDPWPLLAPRGRQRPQPLLAPLNTGQMPPVLGLAVGGKGGDFDYALVAGGDLASGRVAGGVGLGIESGPWRLDLGVVGGSAVPERLALVLSGQPAEQLRLQGGVTLDGTKGLALGLGLIAGSPALSWRATLGAASGRYEAQLAVQGRLTSPGLPVGVAYQASTELQAGTGGRSIGAQLGLTLELGDDDTLGLDYAFQRTTSSRALFHQEGQLRLEGHFALGSSLGLDLAWERHRERGFQDLLDVQISGLLPVGDGLLGTVGVQLLRPGGLGTVRAELGVPTPQGLQELAVELTPQRGQSMLWQAGLTLRLGGATWRLGMRSGEFTLSVSQDLQVAVDGAVVETLGGTSGSTVSGVLFEDLDLDGVHDAAEPGVGGVQVRVGLGGSRTDAAGRFQIRRLPAGPALVQLVDLPAMFAVLRQPQLDVHVGAQQLAIPVIRTGTIQVRVFSDANHNGLLDSGEAGVPQVGLVLSRSGQPVRALIADDAGIALLPDLLPGVYQVALNAAPGEVIAVEVASGAQQQVALALPGPLVRRTFSPGDVALGVVVEEPVVNSGGSTVLSVTASAPLQAVWVQWPSGAREALSGVPGSQTFVTSLAVPPQEHGVLTLMVVAVTSDGRELSRPLTLLVEGSQQGG
ncbi:MAG: hypothetical protein HY335_05965 [Deinococcus sp.]|nr:hypothetical protein [Deinococcus sp.]